MRRLATRQLFRPLTLGLMASALLVSAPTRADTDKAQRALEDVKADIRADYADVEHVSIEALRAREDVLLIDVRRREEFDVSHIPGAIHAVDVERQLELVRAHPDKTPVLYCSVGVRSSRAARALHAAGVANAANLDGSIFEWANRGLPLENADSPTDEVHPYNWWWGRYVDRPAAPPREREAER